MATTIKDFIHSNVQMHTVKQTLEAHYAHQIRARWLAFDPDPKRTTHSKLSLIVEQGLWKPRIDVQEELLKKVFPNISTHETSGASSIGYIRVGPPGQGRHIKIFLRRAGRASGGIDNEHILVNNINDLVKGAGPNGVDVEFRTSAGKSFKIERVIKAVSVGTVGTRTTGYLVKKSDVDIITVEGRKVPISIKQANADFWGGMETWFYPSDPRWGLGADAIIQAAIGSKNVDIQIVNVGRNVNHLYTNKGNKKSGMAIKADDTIKKIVVFGSDIEKYKGAIIKKTFGNSSFNVDPNGVIIIDADGIITNMDDMKDDVYVLFMNTGGIDDRTGKIRSGRGKNSKIAPGVRVIAATPKRAKTAYKIKRDFSSNWAMKPE